MKLTGDVTAWVWLDGRQVGSYTYYASGYSENGTSYSGYWPHIALFCRSCGQLWGRVINNYSFDYLPIPAQPWAVEHRECGKCGDGTVIRITDVEGADENLLRYELECLLNREEFR